MPAELKAGTFLIASLELDYIPSFARTVVLILQYSPEEGTQGVIINRPLGDRMKLYSTRELQQLAEGFESSDQETGKIFFQGGPVALGSLFFLHRLDQEGTRILQGLYAGGDLEVIRTHTAVLDPESPLLRFYLGYAGWDVGQLENEIATGSWILCPGNAELVFSENTDTIWQQALFSLGDRYRPLSLIPEDPSVN